MTQQLEKNGPGNTLPSNIQKLLCEACQNTIFSAQSFHQAWSSKSAPNRSESAGVSYTTPTWAEMQYSVNSVGCRWCGFVSKVLMDNLWEVPPPDSKAFHMRVRFIQTDQDKDMDPNTPSLLLDVASTTAYDFIDKCMDRCLLHKFCPPPHQTTLPTRVVDCRESQPRLFVNSQGIEENYVALSYVWGCKEQPHCTTQQNLASYIKHGIPLEHIPKTIMDAFTVTKALGLHYLWVDAFCIIQDSEEDKAHEIRQIRHIFHNAHLTIIAACADTVYDGFLHERNQPEPSYTVLPFYCPDGILGTMHVQTHGNHAPGNPIDKRAWCLEEHVLSPRKLIYSSHTLQYQCQAMHVNVNGASHCVSPINGIPYLPSHIFFSELPAVIGPPIDVNEIWDAILTAYTRRTVTKAQDRLNAFAGVVEQFQHVWPESRYIAGFWEHHLPGCLLWQNGGDSDCTKKPEKNLAPSWSWASTSGKAITDFLGDFNEGILCRQDTIQVDVTVAHPMNPYGSVRHGAIVLDTIVQSALWHPGLSTLFLNETHRDAQEWVLSEQDKIGDVTPDTLDTEPWKICRVQLAVMRNTGYSLHGLVLIPSTTNDPNSNSACADHQLELLATLCRVGFFTIRTKDNPELVARWLQSEYQRIKII
ncbi:HET-domain-containing protein [Dendrothele bispora CBS 962.96]|uniref:HET-domain-containing protein n=1 Tax=Dendrothele bispora (strain CBS 962.96) TaxID=1314807 RepID=A0A4S8LJL7_DENBC|nr:HET-domain-containing protein [Dendrothele bispora CBS 962.96]